MTQHLRHLLFAALAVAALLVVGCGNKEDVVREGKTEGIYVDVDELKYQIQMSRQLNPYDVEDRDYLVGIAPEERELAPGETWFGVFMRVENDGEETHPQATRFDITDTEGTTFEPIELAEENVFAYRSIGELEPEQVEPNADSAAGNGPIQGSLLLFKLKNETLANRPLQLKIQPPSGGEEGVIDVDV